MDDFVKDFLDALDAPEKAARAFRQIADRFREDTGELQAAWGDRQAGRCWSDAAKHLDKAATALD